MKENILSLQAEELSSGKKYKKKLMNTQYSSLSPPLSLSLSLSR